MLKSLIAGPGVMTAMVLALAAPTHGDFVWVEQFDDLQDGAVQGQTSTGAWDASWQQDPQTAVIVDESPTDPSSKTLSFATNQNTWRHASLVNPGAEGSAAPITDTPGTMFMRFYLEEQDDGSAPFMYHIIGATNRGEGSFAGRQYVFNTGFGLINDEETGDVNLVHPDIGNPEVWASSLETNVWHNVWIVANNPAHEYDVYLTQGLNAATEADKVVSRQSYYGGDADVLTTFYLMAHRTTGGSSDYLHVDDFAWDANSENLSNPVPEPGTLGLTGLGVLAIFRRPRGGLADRASC